MSEIAYERSKQRHTKGPWYWRLFGEHLSLVAAHSGTLIVMDFVRKGFNGAQPRFGERRDNMGGLMLPAAQIAELGWEHPDAKMIAAAPEMYEALCAIRDSEHKLPAGLWNKVNAAIKAAEIANG